MNPWRSPLARALHRNRSQPFSRYLQLATVTPEGYPANRTVVFRGFLEDKDNVLKIITDSRSEKIKDIQHQPRTEACWYFTKSREQFRLAGTIEIVTAEDRNTDLQLVRKITWQNLSDAARSQFAWLPPGKPQANGETFSISPPSVDRLLDNFCLLLLTIERVDHLELRGEPQSRCIYTLQSDRTWIIQPVNP